MNQKNKRSIKNELLRWLLLPLCSMCVVSSAGAYTLASYFANDSYDRNLINTAGSVAARVRINAKGMLDLDLPPAAQAILSHTNPNDKFYYQILKPDLTPVTGSALPVSRTDLDSNIPSLSYVNYNGEKLRVARIRIPLHDHPEQIILVQAAETLNSRMDLTSHILISILIPQILLIIFGAIGVSLAVKKGLEPLTDLRNAVLERSKVDLKPLDESIAPLEAQPLASAINDLLGRLRADLEAQRRFVANAAHQFRTPLAGIQTYVEIVERAELPATVRELLKQIDRGIDRLSHLTSQLLTLAKSEPHAMFSFENVDLNTIASEASSELISMALTKNMELEFNESDKPAIVYGDAANLKELITNLVENAILYTECHGSVSVSIIPGDKIQLIVEDNGSGIPADEREHVFERFYRVLGTQVEGSGLGLAIVKEIAAAHQAEVFLGSGTDGKGTKVVIKFPQPA